MDAWEQSKIDKELCRKRNRQTHLLREEKKATFDDAPDGETGDTEVVEPDGTQPDG